MKTTAVFVLAAGLALSVAGCSQLAGTPTPRTGNGSAAMDGYDGRGPGMMGGGYGPSMMGGGYGPGMMGGGYGPGMMGGGYGPGMMGGSGYGPGMMGGYGYGPGMMGGGRRGMGPDIPDLTNEQRSKIASIEKDYRQKQWALMQSMHELHFQQGSAWKDGKFDEQAARKEFEARENLRKQMFENGIQLQTQMNEVLTPKQREQMGQAWGR